MAKAAGRTRDEIIQQANATFIAHPIERVVDLTKKVVFENTVEATSKSLSRGVVRSIIAESYSTWQSDQEIADQNLVESKRPYHAVLDELLRRIDANEEELTDPLINRMRESQLIPSNWPPAPKYEPGNRVEWLRARVLYAWCPADRDLAYAQKHERWMLVVLLMFICPGIANLVWVMLLTLLLLGKGLLGFLSGGTCVNTNDPYQLLNGIWMFKIFAFFFWGILPIILDHASLFFVLTSRESPASCAALARSFAPPFLQSVFDFGERVEIACFCVSWVLCYALWRKAKWCIGRKQAGDDLGLFTNDKDIDVRVLSMLFTYDFVVFAVFTLVQQVYLSAVVLGRPGVTGFFNSLDHIGIQGLMLEPVPPELQGQYLYYRLYTVNLMALTCFPHVLFKLPFIGELLHQVRLTGFDQAGQLHLQMTAADMQVKWRSEEALRTGGVDLTKVKVSAFVDVVAGGVLGGTATVIGATGQGIASGAGAVTNFVGGLFIPQGLVAPGRGASPPPRAAAPSSSTNSTGAESKGAWSTELL